MKELARYLGTEKDTLKKSLVPAIVTGVLFLILLVGFIYFVVISGEKKDAVRSAVLCLLTGIGSVSLFLEYFKYRKSIAEKASALEEADIGGKMRDDFLSGESFRNDVIRIGTVYLFGKGRMEPIRIADIAEAEADPTYLNVTAEMADGSKKCICIGSKKDLKGMTAEEYLRPILDALAARNPKIVFKSR